MTETNHQNENQSTLEMNLIRWGLTIALAIISFFLCEYTDTTLINNAIITTATSIFTLSFTSLFFYYNKQTKRLNELFKDFTESQTNQIFTKIEIINKERNNIILNELANIHDQLKKNASLLSEKVENRIISNAFSTDNQILESQLKILNEIKGKHAWIVSKFISKQLALSLNSWKFVIDSKEYSKFASRIYNECDYLFLTNSINFYAWQKLLEIDKDSKDTPEHIRSWNNLDIINKKRIIYVSDIEKKSFFMYEHYFDEFVKMTNADKNNTRILTQAKYQNHISIPDFIELQKYDYAIFNKEIMLKWQLPLNQEEKTTLEISFNLPGENNNAKNLLSLIAFFDDQWESLITLDRLKQEILTKKQEIFSNVIKHQHLEHKYAYFARGADLWQEINSDPLYLLGDNEQKFLGKVLRSTIHDEKYEIIHLGSGGGKEIETVLNSYPHNLISKYIVVDISTDILNFAKETLLKNFVYRSEKKQPFETICADLLEDKLVLPLAKNKRLFILASNGYLLSRDAVLTNIKKSMKKDDHLLVTVECSESNPRAEIIKSYYTDNVIQLFELTLNLLNINCNDKNFYDFTLTEDGVFEGFFKTKAFFTNNEAVGNYQIELSKIEKIKIFTSFKPTESTLKKRMSSFKFECVDVVFKDDDLKLLGGIYKAID